MMRRRLRRRRRRRSRHLKFSTHLGEDCQLIASTLACLMCIAPRYPIMLLELSGTTIRGTQIKREIIRPPHLREKINKRETG
jgi:hypothetical protein